jgi:broad specificity phosphatase PhoE
LVDLIFETHATSVDNEAGVASGHGDPPLSTLGKRQAQELGTRYPSDSITEVFCSDLERAWSTAEIAFEGRSDVVIKRDPRLRECNYGDWNGKAQAQVAASRSIRVNLRYPGGESYTDCAIRVGEFLQELWEEGLDRRVLVIGHRATHFALEHLIERRSFREIVPRPWTWKPGWTYSISQAPPVESPHAD